MNRRHLLALLAGTAAAPFVPAVAKAAQPTRVAVTALTTAPSSPWTLEILDAAMNVVRREPMIEDADGARVTLGGLRPGEVYVRVSCLAAFTPASWATFSVA